MKDIDGNSIAFNSKADFYGVGPLVQRDDGVVVWEAEDIDDLYPGIGNYWQYRMAGETEGETVSGGLAMWNTEC